MGISSVVTSGSKAQGWMIFGMAVIVFVIFWSMRKNGMINLKSNPETPAV